MNSSRPRSKASSSRRRIKRLPRGARGPRSTRGRCRASTSRSSPCIRFQRIRMSCIVEPRAWPDVERARDVRRRERDRVRNLRGRLVGGRRTCSRARHWSQRGSTSEGSYCFRGRRRSPSRFRTLARAAPEKTSAGDAVRRASPDFSRMICSASSGTTSHTMRSTTFGRELGGARAAPGRLRLDARRLRPAVPPSSRACARRERSAWEEYW